MGEFSDEERSFLSDSDSEGANVASSYAAGGRARFKPPLHETRRSGFAPAQQSFPPASSHAHAAGQVDSAESRASRVESSQRFLGSRLASAHQQLRAHATATLPQQSNAAPTQRKPFGSLSPQNFGLSSDSSSDSLSASPELADVPDPYSTEIRLRPRGSSTMSEGPFIQYDTFASDEPLNQTGVHDARGTSVSRRSTLRSLNAQPAYEVALRSQRSGAFGALGSLPAHARPKPSLTGSTAMYDSRRIEMIRDELLQLAADCESAKNMRGTLASEELSAYLSVRRNCLYVLDIISRNAREELPLLAQELEHTRIQTKHVRWSLPNALSPVLSLVLIVSKLRRLTEGQLRVDPSGSSSTQTMTHAASGNRGAFANAIEDATGLSASSSGTSFGFVPSSDHGSGVLSRARSRSSGLNLLRNSSSNDNLTRQYSRGDRGGTLAPLKLEESRRADLLSVSSPHVSVLSPTVEPQWMRDRERAALMHLQDTDSASTSSYSSFASDSDSDVSSRRASDSEVYVRENSSEKLNLSFGRTESQLALQHQANMEAMSSSRTGSAFNLASESESESELARKSDDTAARERRRARRREERDASASDTDSMSKSLSRRSRKNGDRSDSSRRRRSSRKNKNDAKERDHSERGSFDSGTLGGAAREVLRRRNQRKPRSGSRRTANHEISPLASPPTSPYGSFAGTTSQLRVKAGSNGMYVVITNSDTAGLPKSKTATDLKEKSEGVLGRSTSNKTLDGAAVPRRKLDSIRVRSTSLVIQRTESGKLLLSGQALDNDNSGLKIETDDFVELRKGKSEGSAGLSSTDLLDDAEVNDTGSGFLDTSALFLERNDNDGAVEAMLNGEPLDVSLRANMRLSLHDEDPVETDESPDAKHNAIDDDLDGAEVRFQNVDPGLVNLLPEALSSDYTQCRICEHFLLRASFAPHAKFCEKLARHVQTIITRGAALEKVVKSVEARMATTDSAGLPRRKEEVKIMTDLIAACRLPQETKGALRCNHGAQEETFSLFGVLASEKDLKRMCSMLEHAKRAARRGGYDALVSFAQVAFPLARQLRHALNALRRYSRGLARSQPAEKCEPANAIDDVLALWGNSITSSFRSRLPSLHDFEIIKPISRGAFGSVYLARKRQTNDIFAIKVLYKGDMVAKSLVKRVQVERDILAATSDRSIVHFFWSFHTKNKLYIVMEFVPGGDMYSLMCNFGFLDEQVARQYIAETVLSLEYLHGMGVIHRDLKPDNMLIGTDGHLKIADFGLSKYGELSSTEQRPWADLDQTANRHLAALSENGALGSVFLANKQADNAELVGTPDYLAPELLLGQGHSYSADWWSLGIILYEFLMGVPPFHDSDPDQIFTNILNGTVEWPMVPAEMSVDALDLIKRLLDPMPSQRLGTGPRGAQEVKAHPWFKDFDWDSVFTRKALFIPETMSADDTSYFNSRNPISQLSDDEDYTGELFSMREHVPPAPSCTGEERKETVVVVREARSSGVGSLAGRLAMQKLREGRSAKLPAVEHLADSESSIASSADVESLHSSATGGSSVRIGALSDLENLPGSPHARVNVMEVFEQFPFRNLRNLGELNRQLLQTADKV
mmetsp:Transcript_11595/g.31232  ORF Transcript_11595/g.31232 Transcript_11595/m.31232 type:complete len:1587 (+) Transcript_11595:106-4866(+)